MSTEIKCECLDILCGVLHKYGNLMDTDHESLLTLLLPQLSSNQASVKKKTVSYIAEFLTGKKRYFLCARDLNITWGDTPQYWKWTSLPESRFTEVAELKQVWWLEIRGTIRAGVLSPQTSYAACLVYKLEDEFGFHYRPSKLSVGVIGVELNKLFAFLVPEGRLQRRNGYEESIYTPPYDAEDDPGLPEDDYEESVYTPPSNVDRYWRGQHLPEDASVSCNLIFNVLNLEMMAGLRKKLKEMVWAYSLRQIKIRCGYQVNVASKVVDLLELKLFSLEKWTGKICYFLGARDLKIAWSDTPQYWKWISLPESRFPEVAKLKHVVLLDIQVKVRACVLSPRTSYAAYLVYKFEGESGFLSELLHVQSDIQRPKLRDDGWFEVELGVFYTESEVGYIEIHVKEAEGVAYQEESLIVEGIEIRPRMG